MQDRFKFRCYNRKTKKMYEVDSLHLDSKDGEWVWVHYYNPIYDKDLKIQIEQPNAIIMQCTGLKDKNGKLIYEGDIVKINDYNRPIEVRFKGLGFELYRSPDNLVGYHNDKYFPESIEVISNIYENPEPLED